MNNVNGQNIMVVAGTAEFVIWEGAGIYFFDPGDVVWCKLTPDDVAGGRDTRYIETVVEPSPMWQLVNLLDIFSDSIPAHMAPLASRSYLAPDGDSQYFDFDLPGGTTLVVSINEMGAEFISGGTCWPSL